MDIERHLNNKPPTYVGSESGEEQVLTPNIIMCEEIHIHLKIWGLAKITLPRCIKD